jgi:hypothetical protein
MFIAGVNNTGEKLFSGVNDIIDNGQRKPKGLKLIANFNDTSEKLFTGVNDTADKFFNL